MIQVSELSKRYGEIEAVKGVSFTIGDGTVVGLLGPNGAGKTTIMRMLTTFIPPTSGSATVAGFDICKQPDQVRRSIGYLPENPPLYPEMRVREYLRFVATIKGVPRKLMSARIDDVIDRCILADVADKLCAHLSRGFRQRVGIAQALIHEPKVIILDEPTSGLDPAQILEIRKLIAELKGSHTVVLSTHILPEVSTTCSHVVIISKGRVVVQGELSELTAERGLEERFLAAVSVEGV